MRVLFSAHPVLSQLYTMIPLARSLQARGHEVAIATAAGVESVVTSAGLEHIAAGHDSDGSIPFQRVIVEEAGRESLELSMLAELCAQTVAEDVLKSGWVPDVIIRAVWELGAHILALKYGVPDISLIFTAPASGLATTWQPGIEDLQRKLGTTGSALLPDAPPESVAWRPTFAFLPSAWLSAEQISTHNVHTFYSPHYDNKTGLRADAPDWLVDLKGKGLPVVLCTVGTCSDLRDSALGNILRGLADLPISVVATRGTGDDSAVRRQGNATLVDYIPHTTVLPYIDACVHHGGYGTTMACIEAGIPVVVVPAKDSYDGAFNGGRLQELGAGQLLDEFSEDGIRHAVDRLLKDSGFRSAAEVLRSDYVGQPPLEAAVDKVEQIAANHRKPQG